ncbi:MAG: hypothetical protein WHV63_09275 [Ignavibacteria bacterium]|jgi:hypothetical protein|nr:hypothetical protein [Ignavibacteria bacterium]MDH7528030.1 hypothetical protein [Ignavibacteria bacterium]NPV12402.1 hypothetical protein [Ignavibacteria bacterium]
MNEKEFTIKIINGKPVFPDEALNFFSSANIKSFKAKIYPDIEEICRQEKISIKIVEKIANTQKIPLEIALGVVRSRGKIEK